MPSPWQAIQVHSAMLALALLPPLPALTLRERPARACPVPEHGVHLSSHTYISVWQDLSSGSQVAWSALTSCPSPGKRCTGEKSDIGKPALTPVPFLRANQEAAQPKARVVVVERGR